MQGFLQAHITGDKLDYNDLYTKTIPLPRASLTNQQMEAKTHIGQSLR